MEGGCVIKTPYCEDEKGGGGGGGRAGRDHQLFCGLVCPVQV